MQTPDLRQYVLALGLAVTVGLAGCSGDETSAASSEPVNTAENLDSLVGGEPLDQLQITLDKLLIGGLASNLPEAAGRELVAALSTATLTLLDAPDELLEALLSARDLADQGESEAAVFQTLLQDTGAEIFTHTRDAVAILMGGLQSLVPQGSSKQLGGALASLTTLETLLAQPDAISDVNMLVTQLRAVATELQTLDTSALGLSAPSAAGVATALSVLTLTMDEAAGMMGGFSSPATGFPDAAMLDSVESMLLGLDGLIPLLVETLEGAAEGELDLAVVIVDLADELDALLADQGVLTTVVEVLYQVLSAVLTPVTGGLSALVCGLLPICD